MLSSHATDSGIQQSCCTDLHNLWVPQHCLLLNEGDLLIAWVVPCMPKLMLGPRQQALQGEEEVGLVLHWVVIDSQELQLLEGGQALYDAELLNVVEGQVQSL